MVEEGIRAGKVPDVLQKCVNDLLDLTDLVRGKLGIQVHVHYYAIHQNFPFFFFFFNMNGFVSMGTCIWSTEPTCTSPHE